MVIRIVYQTVKIIRKLKMFKHRVMLMDRDSNRNIHHSFMINQNVVHIAQEKFSNNKNKYSKKMRKVNYIIWILILWWNWLKVKALQRNKERKEKIRRLKSKRIRKNFSFKNKLQITTIKIHTRWTMNKEFALIV